MMPLFTKFVNELLALAQSPNAIASGIGLVDTCFFGCKCQPARVGMWYIPRMNDKSKYYEHTRRLILLSALINFSLAVIKALGGIKANSHALFADGIHSLSDVLTDFFVLLAAKYGSRQADWDHPYGHQRIETAANLGLSVFIILAGSAILYDAITGLFSRDPLVIPERAAIWIALISVIANECLYQLMNRIGKKIHSKLLIANAWHNRSDAASSAVVVLGVSASLLGYPFIDSVAACVVSLLIINMGIRIGWASVQELIDTGLDKEKLSLLHETIQKVPGVCSLHELRTRSMAGRVLIDVHIQVDPFISVSEGHYIGGMVANALRRVLPEIADVTVHVDPEDDESNRPCIHLPPRAALHEKFLARWQGLFDEPMVEIKLHYLDGKIEVELFLPSSDSYRNDTRITAFRQQLLQIADIQAVSIWQALIRD